MLALLGLTLGCAADAGRPGIPASPVKGPVIAEVEGDAIGLGEVQHLCDVTGLSPRVALERLVGERLLVAYAAEQGYGDLPVVERSATRARVRALLASTIEAQGPAAGVGEQKAKLDQLLAELTRTYAVTYDQAAIQQAFASPSH
jgi:hypothetical protein